MIESFEIGDRSSYLPMPTWPGGASGLTIGIGYDLGYAATQQIDIDWYNLPDEILKKLRIASGIRGVQCGLLAKQFKDIAIPLNIAISVFEMRDIPRTAEEVASVFPNVDLLSDDSFGALVSLVFNRGTSMVDTNNNNRLEMRQIHNAMQSKKFSDIPDFIRSMKRLWQGSGLQGLLARRDAEANLFQAGLAVQIS